MTDQLSRVFAALADPTRRDMVARLTDGDATVGELAAPYDVSMQAVSKHLKVLEEAGLVTRSRDAQRRPVHLEAEVFDLMTKWIERYRRRGRGALPAPRRRAGRDERRARPRPSTSRKEPHHEHHHRHRDDQATIEADPTMPADPHHPRLRRPRRRSCSGRTPTPSCSCGGSAPTASSTTIDHWDARTGGSWRYVDHDATARSTRFHGCFHDGPRRTGSCRPSPGRACPTASRWRR